MAQGKVSRSKASDDSGGDEGTGYTLPGQGMNKIPTVSFSENKMKRDAPAALSFLRKNNATDLSDMLGLDTSGDFA